LRDHRKLLLTDGSVAFVGGAGLTDDFAPGAPRGAWRELMVEIEGPVVSDWQRAFARTWRRCGPELALPDPPLCEPRAGGAGGPPGVERGPAALGARHGVRSRIDCAATRAWIMSAYFVPSRASAGAAPGGAPRPWTCVWLVPGARTDHPWCARRHAGSTEDAAQRREDIRVQPRMLRRNDPVRRLGIDRFRTSIAGVPLDTWRPTRRSPTRGLPMPRGAV